MDVTEELLAEIEENGQKAMWVVHMVPDLALALVARIRELEGKVAFYEDAMCEAVTQPESAPEILGYALADAEPEDILKGG